MIKQFLIQILLIAVNAVFAASEMAFVSLNENKIKKMAGEGNKKAAKVISLTSSPTGMLSAIQICITLAGFLGSAFAADGFSEILVRFLVDEVKITAIPENVLDSISVIVITVILSYFTLVFGELVPKRIAMKKAEGIALSVAGVLNFLCRLLKPVVWLLSVSTAFVMKLLGIDPEEAEDAPSEEDILILLDEGSIKGAIDSDAREMIENVFELDDRNITGMMVHRSDMTVVCVNDSRDEILSVIEESGYSRLPVTGDDRDDIIGILRAREYLIAMNKDKNVDISRMIRPAKFVDPNMKANILLKEMQKFKEHMAIIIDEYGGVVGLVTLEDLLEEIVGNIYDETDEDEVNDIEKTEDGSFVISGEARLQDVEKAVGINLPKEEAGYSTFAGYVLSSVSNIPNDLTKIDFHSDGMHIMVICAAGRKIKKLKVSIDDADENKTE